MTILPTRLDWREGRYRAWELKQQGWKQRDIATALGVKPGAVSQWLRRAREGGVEALRRNPAPGPRPKLTAEQLAQLPPLLAPGAEEYGYRARSGPQRVWQRSFGAPLVSATTRLMSVGFYARFV